MLVIENKVKLLKKKKIVIVICEKVGGVKLK